MGSQTGPSCLAVGLAKNYSIFVIEHKPVCNRTLPMFLHIISFDIPYPANYGGVIVIFNQIKALHAEGVKILLHCFQYGDRQPQTELEKYCQEVYYYPRSRSPFYQIHLLPFIMRTRAKRALIKRLRKDQHPILFQGMHTSALVWHKRFRARQKLVQMHNIEWQYYESLAQLTPPARVFQKLYYFIESIKLQRIEPKVVLHADEIITISTNDEAYYREMKANTHYIAAFHANQAVESLPGRGQYMLYHGKLSVPDNERAAIWLIEEVGSKMDVPFLVAGMEPSPELRALIARYDHIELVENPDERRMQDLIAKAHINLLVSFQVSGIKLKLLNALFQGRFCIVNDEMVSGTGLAKLCYVRNSGPAIRQTIEALINAPFEPGRAEERRALLEADFSNAANARKFMELIKFQ